MKSVAAVALPLRRVLAVLGALLFVFHLASPAPAQTPDSTGTAPAVAASGQPAPAALEPGVIYLVEGSSLKKLEAMPMDLDKSVGGLGALASVALMTDMTGEQFWGVLAGPASELRLGDAQPRFRVQLEKAKALSIRLGKFAIAGKKRRARINEQKPVDFFDGKYRVELTASKVGEGLWELTPEKPLKPGEYGLAMTSRGPIFDFAVEGPTKASKH